MKYWINTVSKDHLLRGIKGGFTQANHGASFNLKKIQRGDFIIFYSPKTKYQDGVPLQKFTAIGYCIDDEPYQAEMSANFHPWRRKMKFFDCKETGIRELIEELDFIPDKKKWGFPFRKGIFEINQNDFSKIIKAMQAELDSG